MLPSTSVPSTVIDLTPLQTPSGLRTLISYVAPRKRRLTVYSFQSGQMQGSISSPSYEGFTPRMNCEMAYQFHAAVPVSQLFFASPGFAASFPAIICEYT